MTRFFTLLFSFVLYKFLLLGRFSAISKTLFHRILVETQTVVITVEKCMFFGQNRDVYFAVFFVKQSGICLAV